MSRELSDLPDQTRNARRLTIRRLKRLFIPHLLDSGWRTGPDRSGSFKNSRPLKVWAPETKRGQWKPVRFNGFILREFLGYAETGIMTDAHGGGLVTTPLSCFPLEDLLMLSKWAERNLPKKAGQQPASAS